MDLQDIEKNVLVSEIKHENVSIWPIIKSYLIDVAGEANVIKEATPNTIGILLKNLLPDIFSIFKIKKSPIWIFTNSERRYRINEDSFDRITAGLLLYHKNYVLFENPLPKGKTSRKNLQNGEFLVGMSWIYLLQFIILKFTKEPRIENLEYLETFLGKDLHKIKKIFHRIIAGEIIYDFLIKRYKPSIIYVVCYYSNFEVIRAAKKNNIPVAELQHGMISEGHRAYFYGDVFNRLHLPDFFLSYGPYSTSIVSKGNVTPEENILDFGYYFLEEVDRKLAISEELKTIKETFRKVICITGQLEFTDKYLVPMISDVSDFFPDICFIFKPRNSREFVGLNEKPNLKICAHLNTYELLKFSDLHITVYSTCALESLALGTPNIAVDIKGYYTLYLKRILKDNKYTLVVNSLEELKNGIDMYSRSVTDRANVKHSIRNIFSKMAPSKTFHEFFQKVVK